MGFTIYKTEGTHNAGEQFFLFIKQGDNYENSEHVKFVVDLIDKYFPEVKNA